MGAKKKSKRGVKKFILQESAVLKSRGIPLRVPKGTVIYTNPLNIKLMDIEV